MISAINHITLSVSDLERAFCFYVEKLGLKPIAKWAQGIYLEAGTDWLCLILDPKTRARALPEYSHIAFSVDAITFEQLQLQLTRAGVEQWQDNRSEGRSMYVLDPDGHKLELHVGDLDSRMAALRQSPYADLIIYEDRQKSP